MTDRRTERHEQIHLRLPASQLMAARALRDLRRSQGELRFSTKDAIVELLDRGLALLYAVAGCANMGHGEPDRLTVPAHVPHLHGASDILSTGSTGSAQSPTDLAPKISRLTTPLAQPDHCSPAPGVSESESSENASALGLALEPPEQKTQPAGAGRETPEAHDGASAQTEKPAGAAPERRSCNRHEDCDAADVRVRAKHPERFGADHCHDEGCEECFGS